MPPASILFSLFPVFTSLLTHAGELSIILSQYDVSFAQRDAVDAVTLLEDNNFSASDTSDV